MKRRVGQIQLGLIAAIIVAVVLYFWGTHSGLQISKGPDFALIALGRLCGLLAVVMILGQFLMISRVRFLENAIGFDGVTRYHRYNGEAVFYLIVAHPTLLTLGYSMQNHVGPLKQYLTFTAPVHSSWPNVFLASLGFYLFVILILQASIKAIRKLFTYEQWQYSHLGMYVAIVLVFFHQTNVGYDFSEPTGLFRLFWKALYVVVALSILYYRFTLPALFNFRHRFKLDRIERITPSAVNVWITGRHLEKIRHQPGQFLIAYFFIPGKLLPERHPFTISIEPNNKHLRFSIKGVGDFTKTLGELPKGTKILLEGPYGIFTPELSENKKVLLVAGGSGITPLRAMIPQLLAEGRDVKLVYGNQSRVETMLATELDGFEGPAFSWYNVLSDDAKHGVEHGYIDLPRLHRLIPDLLERTIYVCGPPIMTSSIIPALEAAGVSKERILYEKFSL